VVAAAPNLTRLSGTITSRRPHPRLSGWDEVTLAVARADAVPGRADLLSARARGARELPVAVRRDLLGDASPGWRLVVRARMTVNGAVAEGYPKKEDFRLAAPA
jgi:hypothetical protein